MKRKFLHIILFVFVAIIFSSCSITKNKKNNYESYNGKLSVEGTGLVNQYGESFRLSGVVIPNRTSNTFSYDLLKNAKEKLNINIVKVGMHKETWTQANYDKMVQIIDDAISLDLYVDIIFWTGGDLTDQVFLDAKEFFEIISLKYKDVNNIIYELGNEPGNSWDRIKEYANYLIPVITANTKNAVILCPTSGHQTLHYPIESPLDYENIVYVAHVYTGSVVDTRCVSNAYYAGIPVFISEWCNQDDFMNVDNGSTMRLAKLLDKYNYSHTFFLLGEANRENSLCMVKKGMWDDTLDYDTLTTTGKFFYDYMNHNFDNIDYNQNDYTLVSGNTSYKTYFWADEYRMNIKQIFTTNNINVPSNAIKVWDMTKTSAGKIIAYIVYNTDSNYYDLYICSDGNYIYIEELKNKFNYFKQLEYIDLSYIKTTDTELYSMFNACDKLTEIKGLNKIFVNDIESIYKSFCNCKAMTELDLTGIDFTKVTTFDDAFYNINKDCKIYVDTIEYATILYNTNNKLNIYYGTNKTKYTI